MPHRVVSQLIDYYRTWWKWG